MDLVVDSLFDFHLDHPINGSAFANEASLHIWRQIILVFAQHCTLDLIHAYYMIKSSHARMWASAVTLNPHWYSAL